MTLDRSAFDQEMQEQKTRAREARKALGDLGWAGVEFGKDIPSTEFVGYDRDTVEDAKVLQQAISAYVDELCVRPVHNYKRNTLETLYMFEIQDQEKLLGVLHRVAAWLHEQYHVEAHWGVGTPCDDLMQFWKSAEEAAAAQHDADGGTAVQV